jgi:hypothetical protein
MKIRVVGHGGESQFEFGPSGPWCEFRDEILSQGHEIATEPYGANCEGLIAHKHSAAALKEAQENGVPKSRRTLVLWEPYIVEKERYQKSILENYGFVYAPSIEWAQKVGARSFNWPQDSVQKIEDFTQWNYRINKAIIIQGNKFSARKGEMYSLRRKVLRKLETKIDLFGTDWNRGIGFDWLHWSMSAINSTIKELKLNSLSGIGKKYKNYFGGVASKTDTLKKYRVAIVIENSCDFVSEKLFDSISSGCIVIYVGPDLTKFGIDIPTLIQVRPSLADVKKSLDEIQGMTQEEQFALAASQNESLRRISGEWENTIVLRDLAKDILNSFS